MATSASPVDGKRIWDDLMTLAAITDPEKPYTRRSFSPRFLEGRAWLRRRFEEAGLAIRLDAGGNLIGRLEGSLAAEPILLGSHSDSVPSGGRFDGPAGIIAALEAVRGFRDQGYQPRHPIEVVDFLAEEPSEYGVSCVGSRAMAGALDDAMLASRNAAGEPLAAAIARIGGDPGRLGEARRNSIAGYLELHIEQGVVLENSGVDLGLVTTIVGIARVEIILEGAADHAGTTPMELRRDAGLAAARLILDVAAKAREFAARAPKTRRSCKSSSPISTRTAEPSRPGRTSDARRLICCRGRGPRIVTPDCRACWSKAPRAMA
jgi:N-carbamoyl-L-amino-acid hydrolase